MIKILDFYAEWCMPCKQLAPVLTQIENEFDNVIVEKINVDENDEVTEYYGIRNIPTLIIFKGDQQVDKVVGSLSKDKLVELLKTHM